MRLPQIRIESQMAKIGMTQSLGKQYLQQPKADLSIEQPKAELSIETKPAKLTIDQIQAWEEMNLMSTPRLIAKHALEGQAAALEGTERRASQGTELMRIEDGGNPLISQAVTNAFPEMKRIGLKYIPSPFSVKIDVEPAELHIHATANKPIIEAKANKPIHQYERGNLHIYMEQYAELKIDFEHLFSERV